MTYKTQQRESYLVRKSKNFKNKIEEMVDGQFNCLDMEIWTTFQQAIDQHTKSLKGRTFKILNEDFNITPVNTETIISQMIAESF